MNKRITLPRTLALILGTTLVCGAETGLAFNMGNMMNPSQWMGGKNDRDDYDGGPQGGPGYGYGGPGGGYGGPYGYGGPEGGYGGPYGYGGPEGDGSPAGYGAPTGYGSPPVDAGEQSEINALRERVRVLEGAGGH